MQIAEYAEPNQPNQTFQTKPTKPNPPNQGWTGKLFFSWGGEGQGQKSTGRGGEPPLDSIAVSLFGNMTVETGEIHIIIKE